MYHDVDGDVSGKIHFLLTFPPASLLSVLMRQDQYGGDIPDSLEGLMSLPGVGPKMAYLVSPSLDACTLKLNLKSVLTPCQTFTGHEYRLAKD